MTVGEVCQRNVAIAARNEAIVYAANPMRTAHVGDLVRSPSLVARFSADALMPN